ncbi:LysR family transcriptional regulator [uncultured Alsobacter sp.]|uniref:LysR family transcriptional regulator n=1 Tax=uncultured Alsobacter sp. TaxID=1748258 RepID=UPI0025D7E669|nr:LysR family transcriptional regulator [uncultured Alsobacter sp.]
MDRKIMAFLAIVEEGTLTAAANRVGLAQPSLTKFLQRLEAELGTRLFVRRTRGMELTSAGESFLRHARRIEAEYRFAVEEIAATKNGGLPVLRIGAGPLYHMLHIPRVLRTLMEEFPGTRIDVVAGINPIVFPMLQRGEVDVVCGEIDAELPSYGLELHPLVVVEHAMIMRPGHPLRDTLITPETLAGSSFVLFQHDERFMKHLDAYMAGGAHRYRVAVSTSSFATGLRLVAETDHLMIAPAPLEPVITEAGLIIRHPARTFWKMTTGLVTRGSSSSVPIIRTFVDLVRTSVRQFPEAMGQHV